MSCLYKGRFFFVGSLYTLRCNKEENEANERPSIKIIFIFYVFSFKLYSRVKNNELSLERMKKLKVVFH